MLDRFNKRNSNNMQMQWGMFAGGLALGSLIGAGVALLLTPRSGEEMRSMIEDKSSDMMGQISGKVNEMRGQAEQQIDSAKREANSLYDQSVGNQPF
jgi:gas vesicle protein